MSSLSTRVLQYEIDAESEGMTIEKFLRKKGFTRQSIVRLKKCDRNAVIDNDWKHLNYVLKCGEKLFITLVDDESSEKIIPVKLPFLVVYEDEDIVVVDKPANMPIHPSLNNYENTLGNAAAYYFEQKGEKIVFRCINRLDRDTSGLTIIAKHFLSAGILHEMMKSRQIKREYIAIVEGEDISDFGTIDKPIGRVDSSTIERHIDYENGEKAVTHYKVLKRENGMSLLSLNLDTGRTHQIRVHLKSIGHPLVGDWLYNPENCIMKRQALHSYKLSFTHPITGEYMEFVSLLPNDMNEVINYQ